MLYMNMEGFMFALEHIKASPRKQKYKWLWESSHMYYSQDDHTTLMDHNYV